MLIHDRKTRSSSKELMELIKDRPQFSTEKVYYFLEYQFGIFHCYKSIVSIDLPRIVRFLSIN
jgi:hypothetical protein